ncbi:hypothetical protein GCM10009637_13160 [Brevibacterium luteolum]
MLTEYSLARNRIQPGAIRASFICVKTPGAREDIHAADVRKGFECGDDIRSLCKCGLMRARRRPSSEVGVSAIE